MAVQAKTALHARLILPGEGQTFTAGSNHTTFKLSGEDTDGTFSVGLAVLQPGQESASTYPSPRGRALHRS